MTPVLCELSLPGGKVSVDREPQPQDARETLPTARNGPKGVAAPITLLTIPRMYESVRR